MSGNATTYRNILRQVALFLTICAVAAVFTAAQHTETSDTGAQKAICAEIERQFWIDVPYVPLGAVARPTAYSSNLSTPRSGILQAYDVARRT